MKQANPLRPFLILLLAFSLLAGSSGLNLSFLGAKSAHADANGIGVAAPPTSDPSGTPSLTPTTTPSITPTTTPTVTATPTTTPTLTPTATPTVCVPDGFEADDSATSATPISVDGVFQAHHFEPGGDVDWVKFDAVQDWYYDIRTDNLTGADTIIYLVDQDGSTPLAENDDDPARGLASRISWQAPATGTYFVRVEEYGNLGDCVGYEVAVRASAPLFLPIIQIEYSIAHPQLYLPLLWQNSGQAAATATPIPPTPTATPTTAPNTACIPIWQTDLGLSDAPKGLAASANRIYTGFYDSASLGVINPGGPSLVRTVATGGRGANGIAISNGKVYMAHRDSNTLSIFNAADPQTLQKALPTGSLPFGVAANATRVFVTNYDSGTLTIINSFTDQIIATVPVGNGPTLAVATADRVFVPSYNGGNWNGIRAISNDGANLGYVATGLGPFAAAYNAASGQLYVSHWGDHRIIIVDAASLTVTDTFSTPGKPYALALNPVTQRLFVVGAAKDAVYVYQMPSKQHLTTLSLQTIGEEHGGQGIAIWQNQVFVSVYDSKLISVLRDGCP